MNSRALHLSALSAALFSSVANAVGFGEITLHSRVGEPLRAEVPVLTRAGEEIDTVCFSLAPLPGSDLPVVTAARTRLVRNGANYRLLITGTRPIAEPVFMVGLRANCGADLQRDYVLMPAAPIMLAEVDRELPVAAATTSPRKTGNSREWRARDGDTLAGIAESQAPASAAAQRRLLVAMLRANPDISPDAPLLEGTPVQIPKLRERMPTRRTADTEPPLAPQNAAAGEAPAPRPKRTAPSAPSAKPASGGTDRVILGTPPDDLKPGEKATPASLSQMEERMLKLEMTLHLLDQEVDKLNNALALTTEALSAQHKLQAAQAAQTPPAVPAAVATPAKPERSTQDNWLELLISALVGGGIAAGLAHILGRNRRSNNDEIPLAMTVSPPETQPGKPAAKVVPPPQKTPSAPASEPVRPATVAVDIPLDAAMSDFRKNETFDVNLNEGDSALELAEIMLSFGRVRGAAETLAQHIEENSPTNIQPWTMLLDLYRRGDMHAEFNSLATKMRQKFNVNVPTWEDSTTPVSGLKSLEDYAHIVWRAGNSWGTQECLDYLFELVHQNRAGQRSGFPLEVIEEIALLMRVLEEGYGLKRPA
ncbi:FimV family protein [Dechloromonas denitrificans]|uniref:type IV pilus assembly protein FimV n=1 Tax=Dechloromonas denitrificans TaxID=281362 RepID=UPI001CF8DDAC|nr:hypothetical protein [Dechloromonas denitrificans]UCV04480.1 hypothetical protein KI611_04220 [Dechloromonas denitrificans]